jgi:hypothetical protein
MWAGTAGMNTEEAHVKTGIQQGGATETSGE